MGVGKEGATDTLDQLHGLPSLAPAFPSKGPGFLLPTTKDET